MTGHEYVLLLEDDEIVAEGVALLLERRGRTTIYCPDIASAEIVLDRYPITHVVSDIQFTGPFCFQGLHFARRIHERRPSCRIVLMTGDASDSLLGAATAMGVTTILAKPFGADELDRALASKGEGGSEYELLRVPKIEEVLRPGLMDTAFQPIRRLDGSERAFAFEALARSVTPWPAGGPAELFEYASRVDRLADLNLAALRSAIHSAAQLPPDAALFINLDPIGFESRKIISILRAAAGSADVDLSRVVLEVTERSEFDTRADSKRTFAELRDHGVRFALDDHGSSYSHLAQFETIRPSFIKIGGVFGTDLETDHIRTKIVRNVVSLARDLGCVTVLEGVESAATARVAKSLGIDLGQGYFFGRPAAAAHWQDFVAA